MTRPTGIFKRTPEISDELQGRFAKISKADWAELYFDRYRQVFGEAVNEEEIM